MLANSHWCPHFNIWVESIKNPRNTQLKLNLTFDENIDYLMNYVFGYFQTKLWILDNIWLLKALIFGDRPALFLNVSVSKITMISLSCWWIFTTLKLNVSNIRKVWSFTLLLIANLVKVCNSTFAAVGGTLCHSDTSFIKGTLR